MKENYMAKKKSANNIEEVVTSEQEPQESQVEQEVEVSVSEEAITEETVSEEEVVVESVVVEEEKEEVVEVIVEEPKKTIVPVEEVVEDISDKYKNTTVIYNGMAVSLSFIQEQQRIRKDIRIVETSPNTFISMNI